MKISNKFKVRSIAGENVIIKQGRFGADMKVESVNDGPVTLILDTDDLLDRRRK